MTTEEAQQYHDQYRRMQAKGTPAEYMRYMAAKQVLADAELLVLTQGQRGFLAAARSALSSEVTA